MTTELIIFDLDGTLADTLGDIEAAMNRALADRGLPLRSRDEYRRFVGNGIDQDVLQRIGLAEADAFVAVTPGDNRNVMACQIAKHIFGVPRVVCRIFDPIRQELYRNLDLETISPTKEVARLLKQALEREPAETPKSEG